MGVFLQAVKDTNGTAFDINDMLTISISNIAMSLTLGRRFDYNDKTFSYFIHCLHEIEKDPALSGIVNYFPFLGDLPGDPFKARKIVERLDETFGFFKAEIDRHKSTLDEGNIHNIIDAYLLEMKKETNSTFTESHLLGLIQDIFAGGTASASATIRWALMYFIRNPDVQEKMRMEMNEACNKTCDIEMADKPNLPYCEAVMLEALRIGNILPLSLPHKVSADIYYNGFLIPKSAVLIPNLDSVANDEDVFSDCQSFIPERFIDSDNQLTGQRNILTFSLGKRSCPGEPLARQEIFLYLTALVRNFQFTAPEDEELPTTKGVLGITYPPVPFKIRAKYIGN